MAYVYMSDFPPPVNARRYRRGSGFGLGSSAGALQFAMAQTAQIKQALQSGDPITAVSIAAGNPWTTKPSPSQVEAMLANPQQGAQILQKLYDSLQGPGYRSPLPGTMPIDQLRSALAQYLSQITPPAAPTPTKAAQQGTGMQLVSQPQPQFSPPPPPMDQDQAMGDIGTSAAAAGGAMAPIIGLVGIASSGLSAYHGYKRNNSIGWAVGWGFLGGLFPIITPAIAFAQGFGEPIKKS